MERGWQNPECSVCDFFPACGDKAPVALSSNLSDHSNVRGEQRACLGWGG